MKNPQKEKGILVSGINPVLEALRSRQAGKPAPDGKSTPEELFLARSDRRGQELEGLAKAGGVRTIRSTREELNRLVGHTHHQGAVLNISEFPYADLEELLAGPISERDPLIALDSIQDPRNLGAILRSACFLGAKGVIIPRDRSAPVTSTVIKTAAGATSYVPVAQVTNLWRALKHLKEAGYWIMGLDVSGDKSLYEADLPAPLCLVIGSEQKGIRPLIKTECDLLVRIPASGPLDSLNAAAAAAIALAEIQRRRL